MTRRGLIVDYGGVLTPSVTASFDAFERAEGLPEGTFLQIVLDGYRTTGDRSAVARLERGELDEDEFEREVLAALRDRGHELEPGAALERVFAGFRPYGPFWDVVAAARERGVATALLSNSWGTSAYPRDRLDRHFEVVVLSGEEGVRKPDPAIFHTAVDRLGVDAGDCVYVDDLDVNVEAAAALGMTAVLYRPREFDRVVRDVEGGLGLEPGGLGRPGPGDEGEPGPG